MKRAIAIGCAVLLLAGCAPNTEQAYKTCLKTLSAPVEAQADELTPEEYVDLMVPIADYCAAAAEEDPAGFIEEWSD